ncbi:MAG: non-canonical purine NTP pyrophosphatase [Anaerolineales bacterium]
MSKLLLASQNAGKLREMKALLKNVPIDLITPVDLGLHLVVKEEGHTYAENAAHKALVYARRSGLVALADDSGSKAARAPGGPDFVAPLPWLRHPAKFTTRKERVRGRLSLKNADRGGLAMIQSS